MNNVYVSNLKEWLRVIAEAFELQKPLDATDSYTFLQNPEVITELLTEFTNIPEEEPENYTYAACLFALDIIVSQLKTQIDCNNKHAEKNLKLIMHTLSNLINACTHSLSFWLPILNTFYDSHIELSEELKDAYFNLSLSEDDEDDLNSGDQSAHLENIKGFIKELENSELSVYDMAQQFFSQSHAMPADFFQDLITDLYNIKEGHEIALLTLIHPNPEVRELSFEMHDDILKFVILSPASLSRLQIIQDWFQEDKKELIKTWIRGQRKKGVVFTTTKPMQIKALYATEVDGSWAQGIFIHLQDKKNHRLCGLLLKQNHGIKDSWVTPNMTKEDLSEYWAETFNDNIVLHSTNLEYLTDFIQHFLLQTLNFGDIPDLHFLEIQEYLQIFFKPRELNIKEKIEELSILINPFTPQVIEKSLKKSAKWCETQAFTESWFEEAALIDTLVNQNCIFENGVKICNFVKAIAQVFAQVFEPARELWLFHFLWVSLWLKASGKKYDKLWQDALILAYLINEGEPLKNLPILKEICRHSVMHSVETMETRKSHLSSSIKAIK